MRHTDYWVIARKTAFIDSDLDGTIFVPATLVFRKHMSLLFEAGGGGYALVGRLFVTPKGARVGRHFGEATVSEEGSGPCPSSHHTWLKRVPHAVLLRKSALRTQLVCVSITCYSKHVLFPNLH